MDRVFDIGFMVLAAVHSGVLPMSCTTCEVDPELKELYACERDSKEPVWELEGVYFYSCPLRWLSEAVVEWYQEYSYNKEFPSSAPGYWEAPAPYLEAIQTYNKYLNEFTLEKNKKPDKTGKNLADMARAFNHK